MIRKNLYKNKENTLKEFIYKTEYIYFIMVRIFHLYLEMRIFNQLETQFLTSTHTHFNTYNQRKVFKKIDKACDLMV